MTQEELGLALLHAAQNNLSLEIARLIKQGADIEFKDRFGQNALWWAAYKGHEPCLRMLVTHGADINASNENGLTALYYCFDATCINYLVDQGIDINHKSNTGNTALHVMSREGKITAAKLLIEKGADLTLLNHDGNTVLHELLKNISIVHSSQASINDDTGIPFVRYMQYLVDHSVDYRLQNKAGDTAIDLAQDYLSGYQYLSNLYGNTPLKNHIEDALQKLLVAAEKGMPRKLKQYLNEGADIDGVCQRGNTALMLAAENGNIKSVELLLKHGADIHKVNAVGENALFFAAKRGSFDAGRTLIRSGIDVNHRDHAGRTALISAVRCLIAEPDVVSKEISNALTFLLEQGADIALMDTIGKTAMDYALISADEMHTPIVDLLAAAYEKHELLNHLNLGEHNNYSESELHL